MLLVQKNVIFVELHSYLTGVTAAQLQWHLPNMNVKFKIIWEHWKGEKFNEWTKMV